MKTRWSLSEVAAEVGREILVEQLLAGKLSPLGREYGFGLPQPIPPEHFSVPFRERMDPIPVQAGIEAGDVSLYAGVIDWVDPDTGWASVHPTTCLDVDANIIYADGDPQWSDIQVEKHPTSRRGTKPKWDWEAIEGFVFDRMDHHGDFSSDDPEWRGIADLEREIQTHFGGTDGSGPGHSTLQPRLPGMIERWRKAKSSQ